MKFSLLFDFFSRGISLESRFVSLHLFSFYRIVVIVRSIHKIPTIFRIDEYLSETLTLDSHFIVNATLKATIHL